MFCLYAAKLLRNVCPCKGISISVVMVFPMFDRDAAQLSCSCIANTALPHAVSCGSAVFAVVMFVCCEMRGFLFAPHPERVLYA